MDFFSLKANVLVEIPPKKESTVKSANAILIIEERNNLLKQP
jgi:hypothetical protein